MPKSEAPRPPDDFQEPKKPKKSAQKKKTRDRLLEEYTWVSGTYLSEDGESRARCALCPWTDVRLDGSTMKKHALGKAHQAALSRLVSQSDEVEIPVELKQAWLQIVEWGLSCGIWPEQLRLFISNQNLANLKRLPGKRCSSLR